MMLKTTLCILCLILSFEKLESQITANAGPDVEICFFDTLEVEGKGLPQGDSGSYKWTNLYTQNVVSNNAFLKIKIISIQSVSYELKATRIKNGVTYIDYDTFELHVNALPSFINNGPGNICYSQLPLALTQRPFAVGIAGYDPNYKDTQHIMYYNKYNPGRITGDTNNGYIYDIRSQISNAQIPSSGIRDTVCYEYKDLKGCYNKQCTYVKVNPNPIVEFGTGIYCQSNGPVNLDQLIIKPFIKSAGLITFNCISPPPYSKQDKDSLIVTLPTFPATHTLNIGQPNDSNEAGIYKIEFGFKNVVNGCQSFDTSDIEVVKLPNIGFKPFKKFCINHPKFKLDTMAIDANTGKLLGNANWQCIEYNGSRDITNPNVRDKILNSVKDMEFYPIKGTGNFLLLVTDTFKGCYTKDSVNIIVNGLPLLNFGGWGGDTICAGIDSFLLWQNAPSGNVGTWSGPGVKDRYFHTSISNKKKRIDGPFMFNYSYQHPLTTCANYDSTYIYVRHTPGLSISDVRISRDSSQYQCEFKLSAGNFMDTSKGILNWYFYNSPKTYKGWNPGKVAFDSGQAKAIIVYQDMECWESDTMDFEINRNNSGIITPEIRFFFYPNPVNSNLHFASEQVGKVSIFDMNGRLKIECEITEGGQELNTDKLPTGIYFILFQSSDGRSITDVLIKE